MKYTDRLLVEYRELVERRIILERTLNDDSCTNMESKQLELLRKQLEYMMGYEEILFVRITELMK